MSENVQGGLGTAGKEGTVSESVLPAYRDQKGPVSTPWTVKTRPVIATGGVTAWR